MIQKTIDAIKTFFTKYWKYGILLLVAAIILLIHLVSEKSQQAADWQAKYQYEHQTIDSIKNSLGQKVVQQDVVITSDAKFIKQLSDSVFKLTKSQDKKIKEVDAFVTQDQQVKITDKVIPFDSTKQDTSALVSAGGNKIIVDKDSVIIPPKSFHHVDSDFSIAGTVKFDGVHLDSIVVHDTVSLRIVKVKGGLFKKEKVQVQIIHSNPDFQTESAKSIIIKPKDSKWNRIYKPILFAAGGFALKLLL